MTSQPCASCTGDCRGRREALAGRGRTDTRSGWDPEIRKAVRQSDLILVCLSRSSINKAGYIQKETKFVLDVADEQPEGTIFVIPLKLEECDVPERLSQWQWVNQYDERGYARLDARAPGPGRTSRCEAGCRVDRPISNLHSPISPPRIPDPPGARPRAGGRVPDGQRSSAKTRRHSTTRSRSTESNCRSTPSASIRSRSPSSPPSCRRRVIDDGGGERQQLHLDRQRVEGDEGGELATSPWAEEQCQPEG